MPESEGPTSAAGQDVSAAPSSSAGADGETDVARRMGEEPPWLRRAVLLALVAVAAYQAAGWAFFRLRDFLGLLFLAWIFSLSLEPVVRALVKRGVRRGAATGLVMVGLLLFIVGFMAAFGNLLFDQLAGLVSALPDVVRTVVDWINRTFDTRVEAGDIVDSLQVTPARIEQIVQDLTPGVMGVVSSVAGAIFQAVTFLLFAYYMSAQAPALRDSVSSRFPPSQQGVVATVWDIAAEKAGGYVFSRMLLALLCSTVTAIFFLIIDLPYWLPLAIWTGLVSQFIPTIGTYLGIGLPALIALTSDPSDALAVVIFGTVYQQVENLLISPRITARTLNMHPAVALGSVIAGASLFGTMGALVAVPVVAAIQSVIETYERRHELAAEEAEPAESPP